MGRGALGRGALAPALLLLVSLSRFAFAQEAASGPKPEATPAKDQTPELEEVVVTATGTNIAGIKPVGSEELSLSRDDIVNMGLTDLHDVLRTLPQVVDVAPNGVADFRQGGTVGYNANNSQGNSVNLRGLGPQATLVLVDGHRVTPTGTVGLFTESDQVPIAALGAIEIIDDGNSAIYGSDAVGGVVNYVIRKDLEGLEVIGRSTFVHGYKEYGVAATGGHTWSSLGSMGKGNFVLGVDYDHRGNMPDSSSPFLTDSSPFGGVDNRIRGGAIAASSGAVNGGVGPGQPGSTSTPGAYSNVNWCDNYSVATARCVSGTYLYRGLTAGTGVPTFAQTSATPNLANRAGQTDYLGREWRYQLTAFYNQEINSRLSVFFEGFFTRRDIWSAGSDYNNAGTAPITINPSSPYYISPSGAPSGLAAGTPMNINYAYAAHGVPLWYTDNPDTNYTAITGFKVALWSDWTANLSAAVGRDRTCGICEIGTSVDSGALQHQVNIGAINPLSSAALTSTQLAAIMGSNVQQSQQGLEDYVLKFDGSLFRLPGGPVKVAVGGEFQHYTENLENGANRTQIPGEGIFEESAVPPLGYEGVGCSAPLPCPPRTQPDQYAWDNRVSASRHISSGFIELYVPIVGPGNELPLVKSLAVDGAGRFDNYSDVGSTTNPKLGLTWRMSSDVAVRGSWGTSFRAPSLTDTNPLVYSGKFFNGPVANRTGDPTLGSGTVVNVGQVIGDGPGIKPERAHNWSTGLDLTPHWVENLLVSATYYHLEYKDEIFAPQVFPGAFANPQLYQLYKPFIHPIHNPANCTPGVPSTYDPALLPFINAVGIYGAPLTGAQLCQTQAWVDARNTNIGSLTEAGLDLSVAYSRDTAIGRWSMNLNAVRVLKEDLATDAAQPATSVLGHIGNLVPWRGRASFGWRQPQGPLSATLFVNYVGTYLNNTPLAGRPNSMVPAWTTCDLTLGLDFGRLPNPGFLKDSALTLSAQNLFARDPPVVLTPGDTQFDANNANIYGRIVQLNVMKKF